MAQAAGPGARTRHLATAEREAFGKAPRTFYRAILAFARAYAEQAEQDHLALVDAGTISAQAGP